MDDPEIQVMDSPPTIYDVDMDEQHEFMELTRPSSPMLDEVGTTGMTNPVPLVEESAVSVAAVPTSDVGCESDEPGMDDEDSIQGPDLEDVANSSQDVHARLRKLHQENHFLTKAFPGLQAISQGTSGTFSCPVMPCDAL